MDRLQTFALGLVFLALACDVGATDPSQETFQNATSAEFDIQALSSAFEQAREIQDLRSLVVARDSEILAELYQNGGEAGPDSVFHVMSVTKSVTATLVGIAIDHGFIESVDQTVSDFFGEAVDSVNAALGKVSIRELLTMTVGHEWREITEPSEFSQWVTAENQLFYVFRKPILHSPGTVFDYSDGAAHLVSGILWKATGMNTADFADQYLFDPLGLGARGWYEDKQGLSFGGVGLRIGPHDMVALGNLYLNGGEAGSTQVVSPTWVQTAASAKVNSADHISGYPQYGYYWWLSSEGGRQCSCAIGYGGQFILVCPDLRLVVVATCDHRGLTPQEAGTNWTAVSGVVNQVLAAAR